MKRPIIGITPRFTFNEKSNRHFIQVNTDYTKQLIERDVIPLILTPGEQLEESLSMCDGILILGGDDINPVLYGETNDLNLSKDIDPIMDETDQYIINYAYKKQMPMLGICRGIQALAVFLGGSLHQDLEHDKLHHPSEDKKHYVEKIYNSNLSKQLPDKFLVNTFHHQSVKKVPDGFHVTYKNCDVIEAMEHDTLPIVAVQWHPERFVTDESKIIFDYFMEKVNEYRKNNQ